MTKKVIISTLIILYFIFYFFFMFSFFKNYNNKENIISESNYKQQIAFTIGGLKVNKEFPQKGEGYIGKDVKCTNGAIAEWDNNLWALEINNTKDYTSCIVNFIEYTAPYLYEKILENNPNVSTRTDFSTIFTTSNNGNTIYKASGQDGKNTYYFAGQVTNNYVKFGTNSSGQELWWRIVRINEDNSVRLIYAGLSASDSAAFISTTQQYNSASNNSSYVGYMYTLGQQYGLATSSTIKTIVDNWYASNLLNSYDGYISKTAIYCNDRTLLGGTWNQTGADYPYEPRTRIDANKTPTFACSNVNDRFTTSINTGNGVLTYPIGLITSDELSYAGNMWLVNNTNNYIVQNANSGPNYWWTMSPAYWYMGQAYIMHIGSSINTGQIINDYTSNTNGVRPVISLKACVEWLSGDGTATNPYTVYLSNYCKDKENEYIKNPVNIRVTTNDSNMATVLAPSNVIVSKGSDYTFSFNVSENFEYESVTGCEAIYDKNNNTLKLENVLTDQQCTVNYKMVDKVEYAFSNSTSVFTAPLDGIYIIEAYGAQGSASSNYAGGLGGYVKASIELKKGDQLKITIGGQNGYNGGGTTNTPGGGATTVQLSNNIYILAAAGGGGSGTYSAGTPGGSGTGAAGTSTDSSANGKAGAKFLGTNNNGGGSSGRTYTIMIPSYCNSCCIIVDVDTGECAHYGASCEICGYTPGRPGPTYRGYGGQGGSNAYNSTYMNLIENLSGIRSGNGYLSISLQ